jgi:transposase
VPEKAQFQEQANGAKYLFFDYPYWDSIKGVGRHKRLYIGRIGQDNEFLPNKYYLGRLISGHPEKPDEYPSKLEKDELVRQIPLDSISRGDSSKLTKTVFEVQIRRYGSSHLLDQVGELTGVTEDLATCFPDTFKVILSVVYFMILESHHPIYQFENWAKEFEYPFRKYLSPYRISNAISEITEDKTVAFFKLQASRRMEDENLSCDTTSISSHSQQIISVKYGHNKDNDRLPQINLGMIVGEESGIPVAFKKLPGNISDVSILVNLVHDLDYLNLNNIKLVLDRGFYSSSNIDVMCSNNYKFLIATKSNINIFKEFIEDSRRLFSDGLTNMEYYDTHHDLFINKYPYAWNYTFNDSANKTIISKNEPLNIYVYQNEIRAKNRKVEFKKSIENLIELVERKHKLTEKQYGLSQNYIVNSSVGNNNTLLSINYDAMNNHCKDFGFYVILSNQNLTCREALNSYRAKDIVEKVFNNFKNRLNFKRTRVHFDSALDSRLFIGFLSSIYISYIDHQMKKNNLYINNTMSDVFNNFNNIKIARKNNEHVISEVTKKQVALYNLLGITPPA